MFESLDYDVQEERRLAREEGWQEAEKNSARKWKRSKEEFGKRLRKNTKVNLPKNAKEKKNYRGN